MNPSSAESLTFEQALTDLERILRSLEDGTTSLEEALAQYERGVGLLKHCYGQLRHAEQKIQQLTGLDANGKPALQVFEHESSAERNRNELKRRLPNPQDDADRSSY